VKAVRTNQLIKVERLTIELMRIRRTSDSDVCPAVSGKMGVYSDCAVHIRTREEFGIHVVARRFPASIGSLIRSREVSR